MVGQSDVTICWNFPQPNAQASWNISSPSPSVANSIRVFVEVFRSARFDARLPASLPVQQRSSRRNRKLSQKRFCDLGTKSTSRFTTLREPSRSVHVYTSSRPSDWHHLLPPSFRQVRQRRNWFHQRYLNFFFSNQHKRCSILQHRLQAVRSNGESMFEQSFHLIFN